MIRILLFAATLISAGLVQAAPKPTVAVVDEAGNPINDFEWMLHTVDDGYKRWEPGSNGTFEHGLHKSSFRDAEFIDVVVRAKGYAPAVVAFDRQQKEALVSGKATVVLERGQTVEVRYRLPEGLNLPDNFVPEVYFDRYERRVRSHRMPENLKKGGFDFNVVDPTKTGDNQFSVRLPKAPLPFYVGIHRPGFLQYFDVGPFTAADIKDGVLEIDVPRPAEIKIKFDPGTANIDQIPYTGMYYNVWLRIDGSNRIFPAMREQREGASPERIVSDLVPGDYMVIVSTIPKPDIKPIEPLKVNPGQFTEEKELTIQSGESLEAAFKYTPFNPDAWRGPYTATVKILATDGSPAAGKKVKIQFYDGRYAMHPLFDGPVPDSGEIELKGVAESVPLRPAALGHYWVTIDDDRHIGDFHLTGEEKSQRFEFRIPLIRGDAAPDAEIVEVVSGKTIRLSDLRGKIVFLEFWATWCGPCQPAMQKLNELVAKHRDEWGDRVAIIGLSIDDTIEQVASHVQQRGWTAIQQYWAGGELGGRKSGAAKNYVVGGVPAAYLINADGKIDYVGHPDKCDLEAAIKKILAAGP